MLAGREPGRSAAAPGLRAADAAGKEPGLPPARRIRRVFRRRIPLRRAPVFPIAGGDGFFVCPGCFLTKLYKKGGVGDHIT